MFYSVEVDVVAAFAPEAHSKDEYRCSSSIRSIFFAIFFTSEIFLQLILTAGTEYLILRLVADQCLP